MKIFVIIVAGGSGTRMGGDVPKQFLEVGGIPVLRRTIECFTEFDSRIEMIVVLPESQREYWKTYCMKENFNLRYRLVSGGITRFHSVRNALRYVPDGAVVAIHDGVRPFADRDLLERIFEAAEKHDGVIPAIPLYDSIRSVSEDGGTAPADRSRFVSVQTPQVFRSELIKKAYSGAFRPDFTDDASVFQSAGGKVELVQGSRLNMKITDREDLKLAEAVSLLLETDEK